MYFSPKRELLLFGLIVCLLLSACGGGGSAPSSPSSPAPSPSSNPDQTAAASAALMAILQPSTNQVTLSWTDTFSDETGYEVDMLDGSNNWVPQETLPTVANSESPVQWQRTLATQGTYVYRVMALLSSGSVPIQTASHSTQVIVNDSSTTPTIQIDHPQPLTGTVNLSVSGASSATSVEWFVDLNAIGTSGTAPSFSQSWDTSTVTNGSHLLIARVEVSPDSFVEVRETVQVFNSGLGVEIVSGTTYSPGPNRILVGVSSPVGVASVQVSVDGTSVGTLTSSNYPPGHCGGTCFEFTVPSSYGPHTVVATATDINGVTAQATATYYVGPAITITSPNPDAIVSGTLNLAGTFSPSTNVTLTATLGNFPILNTQSTPFSASFDLSGLPGGTYTLTVQAASSVPNIPTTVVQQNVTVEVNPVFTYTPIVSVGGNGALLGAENNLLLYKSGTDGTVHLRDTNASTEVVLSGADTIQFASDWYLNNSRVFVSGVGPDAPLNSAGIPGYQIYEWEPDGSRHNLSQLAGDTFDTQTAPIARWPWVTWGNENFVSPGNFSPGSTSCTLFNLQTDVATFINPPSGTSFMADCNLYLKASAVKLLFEANTGSSTSDIFQWDSGNPSQPPVKLTAGNSMNSNPQTDGTLLAWTSTTTSNDFGSLVTAATATPMTQTTVSTDAEVFNFQLKDGLLGWTEVPNSTTGGALVKAFDGTTTTTIAPLASIAFVQCTGGGAVMYGSANSQPIPMSLWMPAQGSRPVLPSQSGACFLSNQYLYFSNGSTIYRVVWR